MSAAQQAQRIAKIIELNKATELLLEAGLPFAASKLKWPIRNLTIECLAYYEPEQDRAIRRWLANVIWHAGIQPEEEEEELIGLDELLEEPPV